MVEVIFASNKNSCSCGWTEKAIPMLKKLGFKVWKKDFEDYYYERGKK